MTVRDDGIGFDPLLEREEHYGLHIMRERTETAGGEFFLDSAPGRGTGITVSLPEDYPT
jgi:signal transduction histidine kinase